MEKASSTHFESIDLQKPPNASNNPMSQDLNKLATQIVADLRQVNATARLPSLGDAKHTKHVIPPKYFKTRNGTNLAVSLRVLSVQKDTKEPDHQMTKSCRDQTKEQLKNRIEELALKQSKCLRTTASDPSARSALREIEHELTETRLKLGSLSQPANKGKGSVLTESATRAVQVMRILSRGDQTAERLFEKICSVEQESAQQTKVYPAKEPDQYFRESDKYFREPATRPSGSWRETERSDTEPKKPKTDQMTIWLGSPDQCRENPTRTFGSPQTERVVKEKPKPVKSEEGVDAWD
jgi:hypothetical protein